MLGPLSSTRRYNSNVADGGPEIPDQSIGQLLARFPMFKKRQTDADLFQRIYSLLWLCDMTLERQHDPSSTGSIKSVQNAVESDWNSAFSTLEDQGDLE